MRNAKDLQTLSLRDFRDGLNLKGKPYDIKPTEVQSCQNVLFDEEDGAVITRPGYALISNLPVNEPVLRSYVYIKSSGARIVIKQTSSFKIYYSTDRVNWTQLVPKKSTAADQNWTALCNFEVFEDMLWITNKNENVVIFDGTNSWVLNGGTYSAIPFPTGEGGGGSYVTPNVPKGKIILLFIDRLFMFNTVDNTSETRYSRYYNDAGNDIKAYNADAWPAVNQIAIAQDSGSGIEGAYIYENIVVFKKNDIYLIRGTSSSNFSVDKVPGAIGCVYHQTIRIFKNMLIFLGNDGLYRFMGSGVEKLSEKLKPFFDTCQQILTERFQWLQSTTANWSSGLNDVLYKTNNELKLIAWDSKADWETGTFSGTYIGNVNYTTIPGSWYIITDGRYQGAGWRSATIDLASDLSSTPELYGHLYVSATVPTGLNVQIRIFMSDDGVTFTPGRLFTSHNTDIDLDAYSEHSTKKRYIYLNIAMATSLDGLTTPTVHSAIFSSSKWVSEEHNLGIIPTAWGTFDADYNANGQTCTFWMKSATNQAGLAAATYVQQTPGTPITGLTLYAWVRVKIIMESLEASQVPTVYSIAINYFKGSSGVQDAFAWVYKDRYYLSCASQSSTTNDTIIPMSFNQNGVVFSKFTGINVASISQYGDELIAGDSVYGKIYQLFTGTSDNGVAIDAKFKTKALSFNFGDNQKLMRYAWIAANQPTNATLRFLYAFDANTQSVASIVLSQNDYQFNDRLTFAAGLKGKLFEVEFQNNVLNQQMSIIGVELYYKVLPLRKLTAAVSMGGIVVLNWTQTTRPSSPYLGQTGIDTDFNGMEQYDGTGWRILSGTWTTATRPTTSGIVIGSRGFNTELNAQEYWDGTNWVIG